MLFSTKNHTPQRVCGTWDSVTAMTLLETHARLQARAIDLIAAAASVDVSDMRAMGYDAPAAAQLTRLARVYFGPTRARRKQRRAVDFARENGHTFNTLEAVEKHVRMLDDDTLAWNLRLTLCRETADYHHLLRVARAEVRRLNGQRRPAGARTAASVTNPAGTLDRTLHLTGPEARVANIIARAKETAAAHGSNAPCSNPSWCAPNQGAPSRRGPARWPTSKPPPGVGLLTWQTSHSCASTTTERMARRRSTENAAASHTGCGQMATRNATNTPPPSWMPPANSPHRKIPRTAAAGRGRGAGLIRWRRPHRGGAPQGCRASARSPTPGR